MSKTSEIDRVELLVIRRMTEDLQRSPAQIALALSIGTGKLIRRLKRAGLRFEQYDAPGFAAPVWTLTENKKAHRIRGLLEDDRAASAIIQEAQDQETERIKKKWLQTHSTR